MMTNKLGSHLWALLLVQKYYEKLFEFKLKKKYVETVYTYFIPFLSNEITFQLLISHTLATPTGTKVERL